MKKYLILLVVPFFFSSCNDPSGKPATHILNLKNIIVVEGCEYFVVEAYGSYTYVHKGNCKNPIHCYNQLTK